MIYIVGGNGFVGSAYARWCARKGLANTVVTRENAESLRGTSCDLLINANGNSRKMLANREPLEDFHQSVLSVAQTLSFFQARSYVFLSSGDVYPDPSHPGASREDQVIVPGTTSRYGLHKRLGEELVRGQHPDWLVMRMGGFVGPGIKKNAIFDLLTGGPVWLSPDSELQFINTDTAADLVMGLVEKGIRREIVNLGAQGVIRLGDFNDRIGSKAVFKPDAPTVRFELALDKMARLSAMALPRTVEQVMSFAASWAAGGVAA